MAFDIPAAWKELADETPLTVEECAEILRELERFQRGAAYLADRQAATAEGLPASTSKSSRARHIAITRVAAELMDGNTMSISYPTTLGAAKERCLKALAEADNAAPAPKTRRD